MEAERASFIEQHTMLTRVPFTPDIRIHTATEIMPLWQASIPWLNQHGLGVPFWCVPWAGGQALARWVLDHPAAVAGKRVLDFGTGSGLIAIAAAKMGAAHVTAVDVDSLAACACELNARANGVSIDVLCENLVDTKLDAYDLVLAGDVWYEVGPAARFARWFREVAKTTQVITGDPGRAYVPADAVVLATYEVPTTLDLEASTTKTTRVLEIKSAHVLRA